MGALAAAEAAPADAAAANCAASAAAAPARVARGGSGVSTERSMRSTLGASQLPVMRNSRALAWRSGSPSSHWPMKAPSATAGLTAA